MQTLLESPKINWEESDIEFFKTDPSKKNWWSGDPNQLHQFQAGETHPCFILKRNVLSKAQCETLIECYERNREKIATGAKGTSWEGRIIHQNQLPLPEENDASRILQQLRFFSHITIINEYQERKPLYSDSSQLVRWTEGLEMNVHADNIDHDGKDNAFGFRKYSTIVYLNDDYEGGETFFPGFKLRVKPEQGALMIFGSGAEHAHGVTKVRSGKRYTYAGWFTDEMHKQERKANIII